MRTDTLHLIRGTPASNALCKEMAERCKGVCMMGFSRGKDGIIALLQLKRFFHTVIPFHIASVPHLSFIDRSLAYYEKEFDVKVLRFVSGDTRMLMYNLVCQPGGDEEKIKAANPMYDWHTKAHYNNNDIAQVVREMYERDHGEKMPDGGWVAFGISAYDSLFRRLRMTKKGGGIDNAAGKRESTKVFFPCFDWRQGDIIRAVELAGLKLPDDYRLGNRTLATLDHQHLPRLKQLFPEDFKRVKAMFPFIEVYIARNEFRKNKQRGVS